MFYCVPLGDLCLAHVRCFMLLHVACCASILGMRSCDCCMFVACVSYWGEDQSQLWQAGRQTKYR